MKGIKSGMFLVILLAILPFLLLCGVKAPLSVEELPLEGYIFQPAFSPKDSNLIAFISSQKGEDTLTLLDLSRSKKQGKSLFSSTQSRVFPNRSFGIRWSPRGDYLLFLANSRQAPPSLTPMGAIWLLAIPSGKARAISEGENLFSPAFSPDGSLIAALQGTPRLSSLWIYHVENRKWEQKLEGLIANCLSWAKDGQTIYLAGEEGIYEVNLNKPKPDVNFFPLPKRIISLHTLTEGILVASVLAPSAQLSPDLLPVSGADIEVIGLSGKEHKEVPLTKNGASYLPELSPKGMLLYVRNTPLLDDEGLMKGVVSSIWEAGRQELLVPYCDGDSRPSISPDGRLLAFVKEGKLCLVNIEKYSAYYEGLEETPENRELAEKVNWMKQIGIAILMYVQDYDENWPLAENLTEGLGPYLKNDTILSVLFDPHFHYHSLPPLIHLQHPSQTVLASWEVSPGLWINLYADGHVKVVSNLEEGR